MELCGGPNPLLCPEGGKLGAGKGNEGICKQKPTARVCFAEIWKRLYIRVVFPKTKKSYVGILEGKNPKSSS